MGTTWLGIATELGLMGSIEATLHPHHADERAAWFRAADGESTEYEYLNLLHALVLAAKPSLALETGTGRGFGALAITAALKWNGFGQLISVDHGPATEARQLAGRFGLETQLTFAQATGAGLASEWNGAPFDFAFFDSDVAHRWQEYEILAARGRLADGALLAFHDTSPLRAGVATNHQYAQRARQLPSAVEFPLSRGFVAARFQPDAHAAHSNASGREAPKPHSIEPVDAPPRRVFRHSGERGDIIYSLPVIRALGGGDLLIDPASCPAGKTPLGETAASALLPLLKAQPYLRSVSIYQGEPITDDLDRFREVGPSLYTEHLSHSHAHAMGPPPDQIDLANPWLWVAPKPVAEVIVCRTGKRAGQLDWSLLRPVANRCLFVGAWDEYCQFQREFGLQMSFHHAADYLELAGMVAGARLVVADQTFVFALAEALKVPRVLEVFAAAPNCLPQSANGHTQLTSELLVKCLSSVGGAVLSP